MKKPILIASSILLASAAWYAYRMYKLSDKLCYKPVGYKLVGLSTQKADIQVKLQIKNLGSFSLTVKRYKIHIYANGNYIATTFSKDDIVIKPYDTIEIPIYLSINPKTILKNIGNVLISSSSIIKNVVLKFTGNVVVAKGGIPFYIPIKYSSTIAEFTEPTEGEELC